MNKKTFYYDSKLMRGLSLLGDYIILNVLYVVCSLPLFTMGAAKAGLYNATRILVSKDNESSAVKAFFRGFREGFGKITAVWCVIGLITLLLGYNIIAVYIFKEAGYAYATFPLVLSIIGLSLIAVYQTMLILFHSRFDCTVRQLLRNTFLVILANLPRSISAALLIWLPVIILILNFGLFMRMAFLLLFLYYSIASSLCVRLMRSPFERLEHNHTERLKNLNVGEGE